ncbi:TetR family transcriptional regulator [Mangrovactinospora gilvigrisea]|uniref:TetR family transcriptional regulator n=1 Tax=Mangrovactinospora gilvigrisea TaxID=1428644 RepID=A0A1J7CH76_9ACTN|nr:TetR/AcrR family transcriptional regulator [Mangrovactinospora gilvigrisea]OIV38986.1 TetR family transcriptional regulator [Mangrovactinospora gilvigrisea]
MTTAKTAKTGARERILHALQRIIVDKGPSAVTLEAVAAQAGVSKGGLLYHFPSKEALLDGLVQRLAEESSDEVARARSAEGGAVRFYLETSVPGSEEAELYWGVLAVLRASDGTRTGAAARLGEIFDKWTSLIREEVDDPVLAETIRLVSDGLYLSAVAGLPQPDPALIAQVRDRLLAQVAAAAPEHRRGEHTPLE